MPRRDDAPVRAILGPTNTGKTHLAIERMCGHSSGVIGFPLRLLAREVYDRVVAMKGESQVALLTGEERIVPPQARYFLCTAESMPVPSGDGHDRKRFPARFRLRRDRRGAARHRSRARPCLHRPDASGPRREETLILGSDTLRPMIRELCPKPRSSAGRAFRRFAMPEASSCPDCRPARRSSPSRPSRSMRSPRLRRFRGGAAVVMGALSPGDPQRPGGDVPARRGRLPRRHRRIGMGLNMDVTHVAFAGLEKFDGRRDRRLTHRRDGADRRPRRAPPARRKLRNARPGRPKRRVQRCRDRGDRGAPLPAARFLYWRNPDLDFTDVRSADRQPRGEKRRSVASPGTRSDRPRSSQD
jgi:ATP-dependent RNA helicase SUPV3L1/SUV3